MPLYSSMRFDAAIDTRRFLRYAMFAITFDG